jgi:uncharacterized protein (TIGR03089 family)
MDLTHARTPADLLGAALAADPARPLVTFYDDATGERVETSGTTFDNWVAKTANLLQDELGAEPGTRVALLLPAHWQTAVWLHACWAVGAVPVLGDPDPADTDAVVTGPDGIDAARACPGERVALSLRPMAGRFAQLPAGFLDYAAEVPGQADRFAPYVPVDPADPALEAPELDGEEHGPGVLSGAETVRRARESAAALDLPPGARVLSTLSLTSWDGLAAGLLAPLAVGGSTVLCRNSDSLSEARLERRRETERVTRTFI